MKKISSALIASILLVGCSDFLNPLPNGYYDENNYTEYPSIIRGFITKGYTLLPSSYTDQEFIGLDCITDDAAYTNGDNDLSRFSLGTTVPGSDPFISFWNRNYRGIYYANRFLKDDLGFNTRYLIDRQSDSLLRRCLKGDAFALRAWFQYDLLRKFGGKATNGEYLGFPIITDPVEVDNMEPQTLRRNTYKECVNQIIADCDSAYKYLPLANRNFVTEDLVQNIEVVGSIRYKAFDAISMEALKAMTYLMWASPNYNPDTNDRVTAWRKAAESAAKVLMYKRDVEGSAYGLNLEDGFQWTDPNSPEIIFPSRYVTDDETIERNFYPNGFQGYGAIGPSQSLVDAFPMANGYPIDHINSGYDENNPYANRDPRFYATVFYNGAEAKRGTNGEVMYTFETYTGGKDEAGLSYNSRTGYYFKKYVYMNWNKSDNNVETAPKCIFYIRWTNMLLIFAEAANQIIGPTAAFEITTASDESEIHELMRGRQFRLSPKEAIATIRSRTTTDGTPGIGAGGSDPYLDECASNPTAFRELIRNERRLETCLEGSRAYDLRRWATQLSDLNVRIDKVVITKSDDDTFQYSTARVESRSFNSIYLPLPYTEVRRAPNLLQNEGWETWR